MNTITHIEMLNDKARNLAGMLTDSQHRLIDGQRQPFILEFSPMIARLGKSFQSVFLELSNTKSSDVAVAVLPQGVGFAIENSSSEPSVGQQNRQAAQSGWAMNELERNGTRHVHTSGLRGYLNHPQYGIYAQEGHIKGIEVTQKPIFIFEESYADHQEGYVHDLTDLTLQALRVFSHVRRMTIDEQLAEHRAGYSLV